MKVQGRRREHSGSDSPMSKQPLDAPDSIPGTDKELKLDLGQVFVGLGFR